MGVTFLCAQRKVTKRNAPPSASRCYAPVPCAPRLATSRNQIRSHSRPPRRDGRGGRSAFQLFPACVGGVQFGLHLGSCWVCAVTSALLARVERRIVHCRGKAFDIAFQLFDRLRQLFQLTRFLGRQACAWAPPVPPQPPGRRPPAWRQRPPQAQRPRWPRNAASRCSRPRTRRSRHRLPSPAWRSPRCR
ncbi:hypothetical protein DdX_21679 [Ditylenchus destructor]|uniref:Uncharacterized protein n=1 Tax=Ditylenchus destructor TaxID=166010 RepID=A0AAD4MFG0_9BILA|nr:hypothetical protein DdX_21679 [Ditylenchus destructor]